MNIALIGYRGTGKTTVAKILAQRLGWADVDADVEVERAAGKPIATIFAERGEEAFRDLESEALRRLVACDRHVLALGGGVVLRDENRSLLATVDHVVWLAASPETIHRRLGSDPVTASQRPNLTTKGGIQEIVDVLAQRDSLYRECAEVRVDTESKTVSQVADEILKRLGLSREEC
jgi:shikimate kinase